MPSRSDWKEPTTNSIPQPFPDDVRQGRRRNPHNTRDRAHRIDGPALELPQSHINDQPIGREQSNTQAGPPRRKHPKMHIPSNESDANQSSMPQGVRTRRGSQADQIQLAQQHAPSSGPIRSRRNQSYESLLIRYLVRAKANFVHIGGILHFTIARRMSVLKYIIPPPTTCTLHQVWNQIPT